MPFKSVRTKGLKQTQRLEGVCVRRVFLLFERNLHMALRAEVVDLIWTHCLDDATQAAGIGEVAVVQDEPPSMLVRLLVEVIDAGSVKERGASLDAMHLISFAEKKLGEIGAVLSRDARDQCLLHPLAAPSIGAPQPC